jgi:hypothetical protein
MMMHGPKFGVRIVTYKRRGDNTRLGLKVTAQAVLAQRYGNWKVYLYGDRYEPEEEFRELAALFPPEKTVAVNVPAGTERDKYTGKKLWMCGGINTINRCLDDMTKDGISHLAILDDDDLWTPDHLKTLAETYTRFPQASLVFTRGRHRQLGILPRAVIPVSYDNLLPVPHGTVHSAVSFRLDRVPLRYVNTVETTDPEPGDADLWRRVREYFPANGLKAVYVPKVTVDHDEHNPDFADFLAP